MTHNSISRRWSAIDPLLDPLLVLVFVLAALLSGCGSEKAAEDREAVATEAADTSVTTSSSSAPPEAPTDGPAVRRIVDGCDPVEASLQYESYVGDRALAILSWTGMAEHAANLEIPIYVVGIEDATLYIRFLNFPMREQYLNIWLGSGHISSAPDQIFLLDPCSARLEPWPS